jgi:hypothetical protein
VFKEEPLASLDKDLIKKVFKMERKKLKMDQTLKSAHGASPMPK